MPKRLASLLALVALVLAGLLALAAGAPRAADPGAPPGARDS